MRAKQYHYTMRDIAAALGPCGWTLRDVYRARERGYLNPESFWSVYALIEQERVSRRLLECADSKNDQT